MHSGCCCRFSAESAFAAYSRDFGSARSPLCGIGGFWLSAPFSADSALSRFTQYASVTFKGDQNLACTEFSMFTVFWWGACFRGSKVQEGGRQMRRQT
jgi:hypothetical protein